MKLSEEDRKSLFPSVEIFREIMIELLKEQKFSITELQKEQEEHFTEVKQQFLIGSSILQVIEDEKSLQHIKEIQIYRDASYAVISFEQIPSQEGGTKNIRCSEIVIEVKEG